MSRWDALRPERRNYVPHESFAPRRFSAKKLEVRTPDASLNWQRQVNTLNEALNEENETNVNNALERLEEILDSGSEIQRTSAGDAIMSLTTSAFRVALPKRLKLASRILSEIKIVLTNRQVRQCVDNLTNTSEPKRIECLARLVSVAYRQMPAEETANGLVGNMFLPVLENRDPKECVVAVLNALQSLVDDSLHASALLAPLTLDISEQGQEDTLTNPLRCRLMRALQALLTNNIYSHAVCTCLIRVIKASNPGGDKTEVDLSLLEPFFAGEARQQTGEARQSKAFELLTLVLKTYPSTSTGLSGLFIGEDRPPSAQSTCVHCQHQTTSPLLDLLHDGSDDRIASAIPCIQELLMTMPLNLWLGVQSRGIQHFGRRASRALMRLIRIVQCRVKQRPSLMPAFCPLMEVILTRIPYEGNASDELTCEAICLLSLMSSVLRRRTKCPELVACFEGSMGGRPQPQGGFSDMPGPMRLWLSSEASHEFCEYLWSSLESRTNARWVALQIMSALSCSLPSFVSKDNATFERFKQVIKTHMSHDSAPIRLEGAKIFGAFLAGRKERNEGIGTNEAIAILSSSIAWEMLQDPRPQFRTWGLNYYASLLSDDWLLVSERSRQDERPCFQQQVEAVFAHCTLPDEANNGVRSTACRCIGIICTQYISARNRDQGEFRIGDEAAKEFCVATSKTLLISLQDPNAAVRSMAAFAVGNLAHAIRDVRSDALLLPPADIQPLCEAVNKCLHETYDKLVNNAIRTIGHLVSLACHPPYVDSVAFDDQYSRSCLFSSVLSGLNGKVEAALEMKVHQSSTWKQRSIVNKHAWGACNSLALVLNCGEATKGENLKLTQHSLGLLIRCINEAESLHEKVASAATASVRKISETTLARISDESGIIGMALTPCLLQLYQIKILQRQNKLRFKEQLSLLLRHLLRASTISDACFLIKQQDVEKETLNFLYDWMVDEKMPLVTFESFALALQRKDLMDDAGLQQKFASRALQLHRNTDGDDNDEL